MYFMCCFMGVIFELVAEGPKYLINVWISIVIYVRIINFRILCGIAVIHNTNFVKCKVEISMGKKIENSAFSIVFPIKIKMVVWCTGSRVWLKPSVQKQVFCVLSGETERRCYQSSVLCCSILQDESLCSQSAWTNCLLWKEGQGGAGCLSEYSM